MLASTFSEWLRSSLLRLRANTQSKKEAGETPLSFYNKKGVYIMMFTQEEVDCKIHDRIMSCRCCIYSVQGEDEYYYCHYDDFIRYGDGEDETEIQHNVKSGDSKQD